MKLTIGKPIAQNNPTSVYRISVENEHRNSTTNSSMDFLPNEEDILKRFITFLNSCHHPKALDIHQVGDKWKVVKEKMIEEFKNLYPDDDGRIYDVEEEIYDLVDRQDSDSDYCCIPQLQKLTYFDANGIEHKVTISK